MDGDSEGCREGVRRVGKGESKTRRARSGKRKEIVMEGRQSE